MKRLWFAASLLLVLPLAALMAGELPSGDSWPQRAKNSQHTGFIQVTGQPASHKLTEIRYDAFVDQEKRDSGGELLAHYQVLDLAVSSERLVRRDLVFRRSRRKTQIPRFAQNHNAAKTTSGIIKP